MSALGKRVILALCLQLPACSQERTWHRFRGLFGAPSMKAHQNDGDIGNCPSWAQYQIAGGRVFWCLACVRLRRHSATAKQYCPSSSAVARQSNQGLSQIAPKRAKAKLTIQ